MLAGKLLRTLCCLDDYTLFILSARFITSAAKGKRAEQYGLSETDQRRKPADFTPPHHQICFTLVVSNPNIGFVGVGIATPIICMRFAEIKQIHHTTRLTRPSGRPPPPARSAHDRNREKKERTVLGVSGGIIFLHHDERNKKHVDKQIDLAPSF